MTTQAGEQPLLTKADRDKRIVNLFKRGSSYRRIGELVGCSKTTIESTLRRVLLKPALDKKPDPIRGLEPRRVPAYKCPRCLLKVELAPCVRCASGVNL
jgi:DNA-binding CsgD family transcriptional regulator